MKYYENMDNFRERTHTIQVTFQSGKYKGKIAYLMGGNCFGLDLLNFDPYYIDQDNIDHFVINDCKFTFDDEYEIFKMELKDEEENTLLCEDKTDDLRRMVVAVEIIDCKIEE